MSSIGRVYNLSYERVAGYPKILYNLPSLPSKVDLRSKFGPVVDQGNLGSCTSCALLGVYSFDDASFVGSRLFLYYNERKFDNDIPYDSGSSISRGVFVLENIGVCLESEWKYVISQFTVQPPAICYRSAINHKAISAQQVEQTMQSMKGCLASGFPMALGIRVYQSFESTVAMTTGYIPLPKTGEKLLGGHAVVLCGYDDAAGHWIMRNSWGPKVQDKGYFYLPYAYLTDKNLCSDIWKITKVSQPTKLRSKL